MMSVSRAGSIPVAKKMFKIRQNNIELDQVIIADLQLKVKFLKSQFVTSKVKLCFYFCFKGKGKKNKQHDTNHETDT